MTKIDYLWIEKENEWNFIVIFLICNLINVCIKNNLSNRTNDKNNPWFCFSIKFFQ